MIGEFIKWLMLGLKPPSLPTGRTPTDNELCKFRKHNDRWKHAIAYVVWGILVSGTVIFFWARGDLADWVGPGFAHAADVEKKTNDLNAKIDGIADSLNQLVLTQLRAELRETRRLHCLARKDSNFALAGQYWEELDNLKEQFYGMTKREWSQPRCEDI